MYEYIPICYIYRAHTLDQVLTGLRTEVKATAGIDDAASAFTNALLLRFAAFTKQTDAIGSRLKNDVMFKEMRTKTVKKSSGSTKSTPTAVLMGLQVVSHMFLFNIQMHPTAVSSMLDMLGNCLEGYPALSMVDGEGFQSDISDSIKPVIDWVTTVFASEEAGAEAEQNRLKAARVLFLWTLTRGSLSNLLSLTRVLLVKLPL